jgi:hypothetical protein
MPGCPEIASFATCGRTMLRGRDGRAKADSRDDLLRGLMRSYMAELGWTPEGLSRIALALVSIIPMRVKHYNARVGAVGATVQANASGSNNAASKIAPIRLTS